ncbi:uncharacterized protein LOC129751341 [Uranotaenia lowii]|uniref:uncharacterized protein LOC129751341 n=1 Tax=Uranotaenia lowii TaxID=190385 RepID=UPI00247A7112|nr:uncharacterized protein LOC129751341 [Uranotaenia lowii]
MFTKNKKASKMEHQLRIFMILLIALHSVHALEIEHPHSYSLFKRGAVLGDMTYSYAATDMGSADGGRVKTLTVIKNYSVPKPISTMFSDRTETILETYDLTGGKKPQHVQYWPPDETNKMKTTTVKQPTFEIPPEIQEFPQEDFKHPAEILEIVKSAAKTQSKLMRGPSGPDTGPVVFPPDAQMTKKRNNGVISVAKEYTSVLTTDTKTRSKTKTPAKLNTRVETPKIRQKPTKNSYYDTFDPSSLNENDFKQTEYEFSPESQTYIMKEISKAPVEIAKKIKNTPYAYKDPSAPSYTIDFKLYSTNETTPELLFSELANAVATRNVSMIKNLAEQLEEPLEIPRFESFKTAGFIPLSYDFPSREANNKKTTTSAPEPVSNIDSQDLSEEIVYGSSTTAEATESLEASTTTTTKKPYKYIAPRLRNAMKRFSSRKQ